MRSTVKLALVCLVLALVSFDLIFITNLLFYGRRTELVPNEIGPYGFKPTVVPYNWLEIAVLLLVVVGHGLLVYAYLRNRSMTKRV